MRQFTQILSYLVGALFIFSGLIKLNDPVGTQIKLEEYFEVFSTDRTEMGLALLAGFWKFLAPWSLEMAVILSVLEVVLGCNLITRFKINSTFWFLTTLIVFFTFLTFYSAYFNKVTDCGCFGDAIKLTPWQSFYKDLVLLVAIYFLSFNRKYIFDPSRRIIPLAVFGFSVVFGFGLTYYAISYEPPIDFRPYKKGNNLPDLMKPKGEIKFKDAYVFTDLKEGKDYTFEQWESKLNDSTRYKYKSYNRKVLNPEVLPKITDYKVFDREGKDLTPETFKGKKLLVIIPDISKAEKTGLKKVGLLAKELEKTETKVLALTASDAQSFEQHRHEHQLAFPYYFVDKTVLKTMIRANPGLILLNNGVVENKWHYNRTPDKKDLMK